MAEAFCTACSCDEKKEAASELDWTLSDEKPEGMQNRFSMWLASGCDTHQIR